jgi:hypothetical protein
MGKTTISMAIFNSYFDITRGYGPDHPNMGTLKPQSTVLNPILTGLKIFSSCKDWATIPSMVNLWLIYGKLVGG